MYIHNNINKIIHKYVYCVAFPDDKRGKEPMCLCRRGKRHRFDSWDGKIPWRRAWLPTPVFLPGESPGRRSLVGYSPRDHKESDTTEQLSMHANHFLLQESAPFP